MYLTTVNDANIVTYSAGAIRSDHELHILLWPYSPKTNDHDGLAVRNNRCFTWACIKNLKEGRNSHYCAKVKRQRRYTHIAQNTSKKSSGNVTIKRCSHLHVL